MNTSPYFRWWNQSILCCDEDSLKQSGPMTSFPTVQSVHAKLTMVFPETRVNPSPFYDGAVTKIAKTGWTHGHCYDSAISPSDAVDGILGD